MGDVYGMKVGQSSQDVGQEVDEVPSDPAHEGYVLLVILVELGERHVTIICHHPCQVTYKQTQKKEAVGWEGGEIHSYCCFPINIFLSINK